MSPKGRTVMWLFHGSWMNSAPSVRTTRAHPRTVHSINGVPPLRRAITAMPVIEAPLMTRAPRFMAIDASPVSQYTGARR